MGVVCEVEPLWTHRLTFRFLTAQETRRAVYMGQNQHGVGGGGGGNMGEICSNLTSV